MFGWVEPLGVCRTMRLAPEFYSDYNPQSTDEKIYVNPSLQNCEQIILFQ
jgi:hypothetical protein